MLDALLCLNDAVSLAEPGDGVNGYERSRSGGDCCCRMVRCPGLYPLACTSVPCGVAYIPILRL